MARDVERTRFSLLCALVVSFAMVVCPAVAMHDQQHHRHHVRSGKQQPKIIGRQAPLAFLPVAQQQQQLPSPGQYQQMPSMASAQLQMVPSGQVVAGSVMGYMGGPQQAYYHPAQIDQQVRQQQAVVSNGFGRQQHPGAFAVQHAFASNLAGVNNAWMPTQNGYYPAQVMAAESYVGQWPPTVMADPRFANMQQEAQHLQPPQHQQGQQPALQQYQPPSVKRMKKPGSGNPFSSGSMAKPQIVQDGKKEDISPSKPSRKMRIQRSLKARRNARMDNVPQPVPVPVRPTGPVRVYHRSHPGTTKMAAAQSAPTAMPVAINRPPMRKLFAGPTTADGLTIWEVAFGKRK